MKKDKTTKPEGESKYAKKVARRKKLCRKLGIPDTPFPILRLIQRGNDHD